MNHSDFIDMICYAFNEIEIAFFFQSIGWRQWTAGIWKKGIKSIQFSIVRAIFQVEENATKRPQTDIFLHWNSERVSEWAVRCDCLVQISFSACHTNCNYKFMVWKYSTRHQIPHLCIAHISGIISCGTDAQCTSASGNLTDFHLSYYMNITTVSMNCIACVVGMLEKEEKAHTLKIIHVEIRKWMHPRLNFRQEEISVKWNGSKWGASVRRPVRSSVRENPFHPFWQNDSHTHTHTMRELHAIYDEHKYVYIFYEMIVRNQLPVGWGIKFPVSEWAMCVRGGFHMCRCTYVHTRIARISKSFYSPCVVLSCGITF